ncbi:3-hydroxy-5-methyl-1-naphthoate 3-O-methyltransferase [bacterium HR29]|jgi:SAM-dependent methyltransferase|nr:3-hydroxy-5-methyl-1-naphthoate 3-O-methyltransferase [bacterium HR29]
MDDAALAAERLRIYALQDGAVRARTLAFCLRIGLFDVLEERPLTSEELAERFGLAPRVYPTLLAFLAAQRLIERGPDGRWRNTPTASHFLVRSSPRYVGGRALLFDGFYEAIGHLDTALATGRPWTPAGQHDMFAGFSPEEQRWFAEGMLANAIHGGEALVRTVDFAPFRRLLDVGGGPGGYTIAILRAHPHMEATIFDLPGVDGIARENIERAGLGGRVSFATGSFFDDPLPRGHDVLLLSSILHDWEDDDCARILRACYEALEPGGTIVVTEPMLADDFTGPDHPSVSGLTMALLGGRNRTRREIAAMLEAAGFRDTWCGPLGEQNSTVTARKPQLRSNEGPVLDSG